MTSPLAPRCMLGDALEAITEFHRLGEQPIGAPLGANGGLRVDLLREEVQELFDALTEPLTPDARRIAVADALGDIIYVAIGAAVTWGIPLDRVFEAIHRSNITKVEYGVTKRADGKILKGPHYVPPDIRGALTDPLAPQPMTPDQVLDLVERTRRAEALAEANRHSLREPNGRFLSRNS